MFLDWHFAGCSLIAFYNWVIFENDEEIVFIVFPLPWATELWLFNRLLTSSFLLFLPQIIIRIYGTPERHYIALHLYCNVFYFLLFIFKGFIYITGVKFSYCYEFNFIFASIQVRNPTKKMVFYGTFSLFFFSCILIPNSAQICENGIFVQCTLE